MDLAQKVTTNKTYNWDKGTWREPNQKSKLKVVAIDFGIKHNILRILANRGFDLTVVPAKSTSKEILDLKPHGVFLSNGPGDPEPCDYAIQTIQELSSLGIPLFGICLGHQLLALSFGGKTSKMKFGHHGANHPVLSLRDEQLLITSQNQGFEVMKESLPKNVEITHRSLFDNSIEGIKLKNKPVFSVQYHPESNPGPQDSHYLFNNFISEIKKYAKKKRY